MIASVGALPNMPSQPSASDRRRPADRLTSSAQQFESMLLGQWLADAESSFATVPGGDEEQDSGGDQVKDFGVRQLASQLTADGGIGIARMVKEGLDKAAGGRGADELPPDSQARPGMQSAASAALAYGVEATR